MSIRLNRMNPVAVSTSPRLTTGPRPHRCTSTPDSAPPRPPARPPGNPASPAVNGDQPMTSWKYCAKTTDMASIAKTATSSAPTVAANARRRNSATSISGSASRVCLRTKTTSAATATTAATITGACATPPVVASFIA